MLTPPTILRSAPRDGADPAQPTKSAEDLEDDALEMGETAPDLVIDYIIDNEDYLYQIGAPFPARAVATAKKQVFEPFQHPCIIAGFEEVMSDSRGEQIRIFLMPFYAQGADDKGNGEFDGEGNPIMYGDKNRLDKRLCSICTIQMSSVKQIMHTAKAETIQHVWNVLRDQSLRPHLYEEDDEETEDEPQTPAVEDEPETPPSDPAPSAGSAPTELPPAPVTT